jgi:hypothetical protein
MMILMLTLVELAQSLPRHDKVTLPRFTDNGAWPMVRAA